MNESDQELVRRTQRGDLAAYGVLIGRHRLGLERYALHLLGQREDAEEALQDTLVRAYRSIGQCREPEKFRGWLLRILINRCRTAMGRRSQHTRHIVGVETVAELAIATDGRDEMEEIRRGLAELSPEMREAFLLKYVEGFSYDEMAELTGASLSALKMRVSRACDALRKRLDHD